MGVLLSSPKIDKELDKGDEGTYLAYACAAMQGWRTGMEDAHALVVRLKEDSTGDHPPKSFFAVYDGHGGYEVAKYAARHLHHILEDSEKFKSGDIGGALVEAYIATDDLMLTPEGYKEINEIHNEFSVKTDSLFATTEVSSNMIGCTAVSCVIDFDKHVITCANSGDSRCIVCEAGKAKRLSEDHKPQLESEAARIKAAGGRITNGRVNGNLNLTRTLGDHEYKKNKKLKPEEQIISCVPDIRTYDIKDETDFLVLGCDGIWDVMLDQETVNFVTQRLLPRDCLTEEEKKLSTISNIQRDSKHGEFEDPTEKAEWPGDVATSLEDLLCLTASQLVDKCLAPNTSCIVGCDNMSALIVLNRQGNFGKRVISALNERLAKAPPPEPKPEEKETEADETAMVDDSDKKESTEPAKSDA